ncbi:unnamed protein product, partial [Linum tenue]
FHLMINLYGLMMIQEKDVDLSSKIEEGFGPNGLGILSIKDVRTCLSLMIQVVYGEDELAYQIGETTEILSGGYLCATPHCVRVLP